MNRSMHRLISLVTVLAFSHLGYSAERPNVLLVLSDDHSVPHLGSYGCPNCEKYHLTPNLDAFAREGMRFQRAYTSAPQCAPSRISIFAGRSPVGISATRFAQPARPGTVFFTDVLRQNGYWVGLDGRHQHLEGRLKEDPHIEDALIKAGLKGPEFESRFDHFVRGMNTRGENLARVAGQFSAALDEVPSGKPFFLYFGFTQPHREFLPDHEEIAPDQLVLPEDWPDLPEVRLDYARYLSEVRDLDRGFGSILEVLKERGLEESTMVFFMGDNGDALLRGKATLHPRGVHVPLIVRWPGKIVAGTQTDVLVSGIDLAPTILEAAGLSPAPGMTGHSFLPELLGREFDGQKQIFAERGWHFGPVTRTDGFDLSRSIVTRKHLFIYNVLPERPYEPFGIIDPAVWEAIIKSRDEGTLSEAHRKIYFTHPRPVFELYDLEQDPLGLNNLAGRDDTREIETSLREEMDRWMIREGDYLPLPNHAVLNLKKPKTGK